jgi:sec-independent protein translocase protein TatA
MEPKLMAVGTQELLIVLAIVVVLFGATKIPQIMRGMGQGIREFKEGMKPEEKSEAPPAPHEPKEKPS